MLEFVWGHYLYLLSVLTAHCTHRCRRCWCVWSCSCAVCNSVQTVLQLLALFQVCGCGVIINSGSWCCTQQGGLSISSSINDYQSFSQRGFLTWLQPWPIFDAYSYTYLNIFIYIYIYLFIQMSSMSFHTCIHAIGDMICKDMQTNTFTERVQDSMCHSQDKPLKHSSLQCDTCRCGSCISARTHSIGRKLSFYNRGDHDWVEATLIHQF